MTVHDQYLVCGNSDGTIRFYDDHFKVEAWFEDLNLSTIKSISFSKTDPKAATDMAQDDVKGKEGVLVCSDFLVTDDSALVCMLQSTIFEEIEPQKKKGYTIFHGLKSSISAIAVHPTRTILAIAGYEKFILLWDYQKKGDPILNNYELFRKEETKEKDQVA
jgi:WD40 repeat protein